MLTPSYLLRAVEPAEEIAEKLHQDLMDRIIERILLRLRRGDGYILTAQDKWQIETMQQAGFLLEEIQKELAKSTGYMVDEIKEAMEDAGVRALEYDDSIYRAAGLDPVPLVQSPHLIQLMQRGYEATLGEWQNFTRTTATACQQAFIKACDNAYHSAMTGAISPAQAVREALEEAIEDGVYVQYPTGHRDTIETATARAVRTGISQATAEIQLARMDEMDVDLVLVSSHLGARPEHAVWQGKVYSRSGKHPDYPELRAATGYGTVTGLCGANCRHNFGPYFEGDENPFDQYDTEENQKQYELEQRQRTLERRIRNTKRETMNWKTAADSETDPLRKAEFTAEYERKAALLQRQNKAYNDFCESTGQKKRSERINIAKWDRSQAAKARAAANKYRTDFTTQKNSATIKMISGARITDQFGDAATEHAERYYGLVRSMTTDVSKISQITGYSESDIQKVKDYVFIDKHDLGDGEPRRFDPSFAMAQSWQRLIDGHPEPHDVTLIQHEIMERRLVESGMSQDEAHIITTEKYNYMRESDDYYAALKEYKNRER